MSMKFVHPEMLEEFNKLKERLADANPSLNDEELFHFTKMIQDAAHLADTKMLMHNLGVK